MAVSSCAPKLSTVLADRRLTEITAVGICRSLDRTPKRLGPCC